MNVGTLLPRQARYRGEHLALVCGPDRLSYAELAARVNTLVNALHGMGLRKGDSIAVLLPNCTQVLEIYWAAAQSGMVLVPLSPLLRGATLATLLRNADTRAVFAGHDMVQELDAIRADVDIRSDAWVVVGEHEEAGYRRYADLVHGQPDIASVAENAGTDPFNIIYSSGTTGDPKGIIHTHDIRGMYCTLFSSAYRITPESVILHGGSLVFNGAFLTLMPALYLGATYILQCRFDPVEFIETIAREGVTHVKMVPSQIIAMLNAPNFSVEKLRTLQMVGSVGAPLHRQHKDRLLAALPNVFYELYGLTEGVMTILDRDDVTRKTGSVGCAPAFMEIRVVGDDGHDAPVGGVGEIIGRSPMLMPGYHKRPDLTAQAIVDGWLHTGDMGYLDEDGFLFLVDRKKDLIISGGVNVYPKDIEEVLVTHPDVLEAAVFGVPDEKWGEAPLGAVVLRIGAIVRGEELKVWLNARVGARYQQVREITVLPEFPRNAAGKTMKRLMRDEYWKDAAAVI